MQRGFLMNIVRNARQMVDEYKSLNLKNKKGLLYLGLSVFFTLFTYPMTRSTTTALFLDTFGAKNSPSVWFFSVLALVICVQIYNSLYQKVSIQNLFVGTSLFTIVFFIVGIQLFSTSKIWAYPLYVWKEVYIVLLVHMSLGLFNASHTVSFAKIFYGALGVFGSLGGILGGILSYQLTSLFSTEAILIISNAGILVGAIMFMQTNLLSSFIPQPDENEAQKRPLRAVKEVRPYVFYLVLVIALSQFVINLANFKFDVLFASLVLDKDDKTKYLSLIYATINTITILIQILIIPFVLRLFKQRSIHISIPMIYMVNTIVGIIMFGSMLVPVAMAFIFFKALDYSLFSAAKEILYFPLNTAQRYGAKYIVDMVAYRGAKGLISFFLIFVQNGLMINILLVSFLLLWPVVLFKLFNYHALMVKKV